MLTPEDASIITAAAEGLSGPLYEALDHAYTAAHGHYDESGMTGVGYTKGRTDLARDHARRFIEQRYDECLDLGGWEPVKSSSGRLHLRNGMMTLRLLHATPFDMIPAPGRNKARISYYYNRTVDLFGVEASNLLAVWLSPPEEGGEISVRIVRPIGEWKPGQQPKFDLDFELPRNTESFTEWEFVPDDKGLALPFEFEEDQREEGEGSGT
ncbi:hypothetical protein [Streptomyces sp. OM5714]|uniref:hypothetical protein n=1 Tax=Streptomyces sp. OM5714 TaxID=2602736 RepID=UPI0013DA45AE|nr:hypothetical protein [Streptomyces sp. OM5714]KAF2779085.1 hypothetical protein STPH1_3750 [Streptomyces sp. OM5714]